MEDLESNMCLAGGEIIIKPARYEDGWHCIGSVCELDNETLMEWENLTGADSEYFDALDYFQDKEIAFSTGSEPEYSLRAVISILKKNNEG